MYTFISLNNLLHSSKTSLNIEPIKILNKKGIINIGGPTRTVYEFAKKYNQKIKGKINSKKSKTSYPSNCSMNLSKLKKMVGHK